MRYLVTGASGFIGSHLVNKLVQQSATVAVLVRPTSELGRIQNIVPRLHLISGDLRNLGSCRQPISDFAPDVVFHLAWSGAGSSRYLNDPRQVLDNIPGSLALVGFAREVGVKAFVSVGTVLEYGQYLVPVAEHDHVQPTSLYGMAKHYFSVLAMALCQAFDIRFCHVRLFWTFGAMDDEHRLIPYVIRTLLRGEKPSLTPGEQRWDYLYVEDAIDALYRLAVSEGGQGVFNLGSGEANTIRSIVEQIRDLIDPSLPLGFGEVAYSPDQIMHLVADVSKLCRITGWRPLTCIGHGLKQTVQWYAQHD